MDGNGKIGGMKQVPDEKKTEVTATTKVKLTIRGQVFEMTMNELKSLHEKIGKVVGEKPPTIVFSPQSEPRQRPWPYVPPQWLEAPVPPPDPRPFRVTCSNTLAASAGKRLSGGYYTGRSNGEASLHVMTL